MTINQIVKKLNTKTNMDKFVNLFYRWDAEKQYEDIKEYSVAFSKMVSMTVAKATKRPFGFHFQGTDGLVMLKLKLKGNKVEVVMETI
jgi:hypothetical protein